MKRILACGLIALLFCCGCDAGGKPEPIHLDDETLGGLLPGQGTASPQATSGATGSDVLDQLLGLAEGITVPEIPGMQTQELYDLYTDLKEEVEKAAKDGSADKDALRARISQARETLKLAGSQGDSAKSEGRITEDQASTYQAFLDALDGGLGSLLEQLDK